MGKLKVTGLTGASVRCVVTNVSVDAAMARDHLRVEIAPTGATSYHMDRERFAPAHQFGDEYGRYSDSDVQFRT